MIINNSTINTRSNATDGSKQDVGKQVDPGVATTGNDSVKKSADAEKNMLNTLEVDTAKVEQIRNAIANGTYKINAEAIAGKILDEQS